MDAFHSELKEVEIVAGLKAAVRAEAWSVQLLRSSASAVAAPFADVAAVAEHLDL